MFRSRKVRTGIDVGGAAVKLVRGQGTARLVRVSHLGWEPLADGNGNGNGNGSDRGQAAGEALRRLLQRLKLGRRHLGHIAVGLSGRSASFREVEMPVLAESELRRALKFEAGRHLNLDGMAEPILDAQILGPGDKDPETGNDRMRVLLVAVPRAERDALLDVLQVAGLDPDVVELQPLAGLSAVLAQAQPAAAEAIALLDLGARHAAMHVSGRAGALLSRTLIESGPPAEEPELAAWSADLCAQASRTLTFYRGRHRRQVERIVVVGCGGLIPGVLEQLQQRLEVPVAAFDALAGLAEGAGGRQDIVGHEPLFATACGLCRWWDGAHV